MSGFDIIEIYHFIFFICLLLFFFIMQFGATTQILDLQCSAVQYRSEYFKLNKAQIQ